VRGDHEKPPRLIPVHRSDAVFVTVNTNDIGLAAINADQITHMTIAAFSGAGCKIHFVSKEALSVRDTMEEVLAKIEGKVAA
jgi:hypothetical protein